MNNKIINPVRAIYEGGTGTGKTFKFIESAKALGTFAYLTPCRQLVYETAIKYANRQDVICTGELYINSKTVNNNIYAVYESFNENITVDTVVIDEAHFITDKERGQKLLNIINNFQGNIILCTATRTFRKIKGFELHKLPKIYSFKKLRVNKKTFLAHMKAGEPSIYFHTRISNCGDIATQYNIKSAAVITASTPPYERLEAQIKFTNGELNLIECTNVIAQGLNFPTTNIFIEVNDCENDVTLLQKIGRLGRYGITNKNAVLTYCIQHIYDDDVKISQCIIKQKPVINNINNHMLDMEKEKWKKAFNIDTSYITSTHQLPKIESNMTCSSLYETNCKNSPCILCKKCKYRLSYDKYSIDFIIKHIDELKEYAFKIYYFESIEEYINSVLIERDKLKTLILKNINSHLDE